MNFLNKKYHRIVIKIGSSLLIDNGKVRKQWLKNLAQDIAILHQQNTEVIIVTSGAVALGKEILKKQDSIKLSLPQKQACASAGQIKLMSIYYDIFAKENLAIAQILLTASDCNARERFFNCQNTINNLLSNNAIPIINENDSIAVDEIKIGDNDRLASRVAQMVNADLLILFSDIDGLYDKNPKTNSDAKFIKEVKAIDSKIEKMAKGSSSKVGTGGMVTKIQAVKMLRNSNCHTVITSGIENNPLEKLIQKNKKFTIFYPTTNKDNNSNLTNNNPDSRSTWLRGVVNPKGEIIINKLASQTLQNKKASLLAVGAIAVKGNFNKGDIIFIKEIKGQHIATGITNYSSLDAKKILEKNSQEIKKILGNSAKPELVHLDNLVIVC